MNLIHGNRLERFPSSLERLSRIILLMLLPLTSLHRKWCTGCSIWDFAPLYVETRKVTKEEKVCWINIVENGQIIVTGTGEASCLELGKPIDCNACGEVCRYLKNSEQSVFGFT